MAGQKKEHDWFAETLANPSFSNTDFKTVGINASNTSLASIDVYLNSPEVQRQKEFQTNGKFDQSKVVSYYTQIAKSYNTLANDTYEQDLDADKNTIFSQYNFYVNPERRRTVVPAEIDFVPNPDHVNFGVTGFNTPGKITKTPEELSESQPIWDPDTKTWTEDTPEDSFFKYLFRPTVLATWDYDADINGNPTSDPSKIAYYKGQPKVNENGEYYQEFLNGRSSDGKKLLHKTNILTREDSWINKYDPFDNDGFDKSVWGSITSNAIKIVPLFIPYVREAYLYTSLGLGAAQALTTLSKMFVGSDNAFLNTASSVMESFHQTTSEYASEHAFSMENVLNMVGDTFEFLKGQRFLAEKAPGWFSKKIPKNQDAYNEKVQQMVATKMSKMRGLYGGSEESMAELNKALQFEAQAQLQQQIQNYQKLGQQISKNYMAITFGTHTYSTAKAQGVSDEAATILTLGAIGGQYALLSSHIGNWIFPEAKMEAQEMKLIAEKVPGVLQAEAFKTAQNSLKTAVTVGEKLKSFKDIFKIGKSIAGKVYNSPMKTTAQAAVAGSIASGVEMTAFSVLDDIIAQTYNLASWLGGSDHRMQAWENMGERYLTSFLGGALAGVMSAKELYNTASALHNLSPEQAFEKLVHIVYTGKTPKFLKELEETTWGNKYLSTEKYITTEDGTDIYKQGTEINNQDKLIKDAIKNTIKIIQRALDSNDALINPDSLLSNEKTIGLVKASLLQGSVIVKDYLGNLNKKMAELVEVQNKLDGITDAQDRKQEKEIKRTEKENTTKLPVNELDNLSRRKNELIKEIHKYKTGENIADYMPIAIFDMSPGINSAFINGYFGSWVKAEYKKDFEKLTRQEREKAIVDYKEWVNKDKPRAIYQGWDLFKRTNSVASEYLGKLKDEGVFEDMDLSDTKALKYLLEESAQKYGLTNVKSEGPISGSEILVAGSRNFNQNITAVILRRIINDINKTKEYEVYAELFDNLRAASQQEDLADFREELTKYLDNLELFVYKDKILDLVESDLKDRKYIDPDFKRRLTSIISDALSTSRLQRELFDEGDYSSIAFKSLFESYDVAKIMDLDTFSNKIMKDYVDLEEENVTLREDNTTRVLNDVNDFNLLDTISNFGKSITNQEFDLAQLLNQLELVFDKNQETIDKFFLGQDKLNQIELGLLVLDMFKSHTIATNNVVDSVNNVYGFNVTVNSMDKNSKLTVLEPKYVASQLQTLHMLSVRLEYFKKLAEYARQNKFNEIANVENNFRVTLYSQLKNKFDKIPTDWNGIDELKTSIDGLTDLQELSQASFSSLSNAAQLKLLKDYTNFEQSIHDFFQKNMDKINSKEKLMDFLKLFNLTEDYHSSINDKDFRDDQALVWYIASLAALDPKQFYSNLIKSDIGNVALTFSRMTQVNLIASKIFKQDIFDKFTQAYNQIVDNELMTKDSTFYKFSGYRVKFTNTVFLSSGAGAGKSFAILPLTLNFIRQVNKNLLNNCWVASTCPVGEEYQSDNSSAVKLKEAWKLNSKKNAFTKYQLMKMISSDWHESLNDKLELDANDRDIEVDQENGIVKYNFKLKQYNKADLPDVIIIDEIADYSELDMELIDRFARENKINVIVAGDLEQVGLVGKKEITVKNTKNTNYFALTSNQFVHTIYNTANYRNENSLQDKNITFDRLMQSQTDLVDPINVPAYVYYEDRDKGLYGRKVFGRTQNIQQQKDYIDFLVRTRNKDEKNNKKNKIGYVYDSKESEIYKYIYENYRGEFDFFYRYPLKGEESQYYVFDLYNEPSKQDRDTLIKTLYTVFTRSKQGTLFIKPGNSLITSRLTSTRTEYVTVAGLDFVQLGKYSKDISNVLKQLYPEVEKIESNLESKNESETKEDEEKKESKEEEKSETKKENKVEVQEEQKELTPDTQKAEEPDEVVSDENVVFKASGISDGLDEVTLIDLPSNPVRDQLSTLNDATQPSVKNFLFEQTTPYSILLSKDADGNNRYVKFDIREIFDLGLYTRFNSYTGLVADDSLGFKVSDGEKTRIDNYYGLQNMFRLLDVNQRSRDNYTVNNDADHNIQAKRNVQRFLQNLRELNYRIADRKQLEDEIYSLIKRTFGVELQDPFIRFIWESAYYDSNHDRFIRRKKETPDDPRLKFNSAKSISLLIGSNVNGEDKILTTVSLAKLPHWRTVIKRTGESTGNFFRDLLSRIEQETEEQGYSRSHKEYEYRVALNFQKELENILLGVDNRKYYLGTASLYHLLKIFLFNSDGVAYIDKGTGAVDNANIGFRGSGKRSLDQDSEFTLAKYFETTGPFPFANERQGDVIDTINVNIRSTEQPIAEYYDVRELVKSGQFTISPILITKEDLKSVAGTTLIHAGRPTILVGDSSLDQTQLLKTYSDQVLDPTLPIRVKRVYLKNPESNATEYMEQLTRWASKKSLKEDVKEPPLIGNDLTSYRILKYLNDTYSDEFRLGFKDAYGEITSAIQAGFDGTFDTRIEVLEPEVLDLFERTKDMSSTEILVELKKESSYRKMSYGRLLNLTLRTLIDPKYRNIAYKGKFRDYSINDRILEYIEKEQEEGRMKSIFYNVRFGERYGSQDVNGVTLYKIKTDTLQAGEENSYTLNEKPFTVNTVMTPILKGDLFPLITKISNSLKSYGDGVGFTGTGAFARDNARPTTTPKSKKAAPSIQVKIDKTKAESLGLLTSGQKIDSDNINSIIQQFKEKGYPAFKYNDVHYFITSKPAEALDNKILSIDVKPGLITIQYDGPKQVKLLLTPKTLGGRRTFTASIEHKVIETVVEDVNYYDTLLKYERGELTVDSEDRIANEGIRAIREFNEFREKMQASESSLQRLKRRGYIIDEATNRIEVNKENLMLFIERSFDSDVKDELYNTLRDKKEETSREIEKIIKSNCVLNI